MAIERLVDELDRSYAEAQERMSDPSVYNDHRQAADAGRRLKELETPKRLADEWRQARDDLDAARDDPELAGMAAELESDVVRTAFRGISLTLRCGAIPDYRLRARIPVDVLPFADESAIAHDMERADVLYLPLPFGERHRDFVRLSLSTKLVSYLASGLPIVYHGPPEAAAARLLAAHDAGVLVTSLDPETIARALLDARERADALGRNALALARTRFDPDAVRRRFWRPLTAANL